VLVIPSVSLSALPGSQNRCLIPDSAATAKATDLVAINIVRHFLVIFPNYYFGMFLLRSLSNEFLESLPKSLEFWTKASVDHPFRSGQPIESR
jgi:hypothetical protein